jgi:hypothetical protein
MDAGGTSNVGTYPCLSDNWHGMFHPFIIDDQASISLGRLLIFELPGREMTKTIIFGNPKVSRAKQSRGSAYWEKEDEE